MPGMNIINDKNKKLITLFLSIIIFLTFMLCYLPLMKNWFLSDDIQWIWSSATHQFKEIFFVPEIYRSMAINFTPMLGASFRIDWMLFKMNPTGYSIHSLLSLIAASLALYFFLRLYVQRNPALFGVLLFLLSPITLAITSWFSTRHYLEGLLWALLCLIFFITGERKNRLSVASGICYVLASLNKEVYVVLPAVAVLLSTGTILKRLKYTLPFWIGLALYTGWRVWIMGGIGGYPSNQSINLSVMLPLFYKVISYFSSQWFGDYYAFFYVFLFIAFVLSLKYRRMLFIFLILSLPILPVTNIMDESYSNGRYFFHIAVFLICTVCVLMELPAVKGMKVYKGFLFLTCLIMLAMFIRQDSRLLSAIFSERLAAKETGAAFVASEKKYMQAEQPLWFYEGLRKINRKFLGKEIRTRIVPPANFLDFAAPEKLKEIRESGVDIPYEEIRASQKKFKQGPFSVRLIVDGYKLTWAFGPDRHILYTVLRGPVSGLYYNQSVVGTNGSIMLGKVNQDEPDIVYIKVFYHSQRGEAVTSPEFVLEIPGNQNIEFSHYED
jgi:hypothetical protein